MESARRVRFVDWDIILGKAVASGVRRVARTGIQDKAEGTFW